MLGENVDLDVHLVAGRAVAESGHLGGVGDDGDLERVVGEVEHGEADAVDGAASLLDHVSHEVAGDAHDELRGGGDDLTHGVDVAEHDVAPEAAVRDHRTLEIHGVARLQATEVRAAVGLVGHVGDPPVGPFFHQGEAAAVHGNGGTDSRVSEHRGGRNGQPGTLAGRH